MGHIPEPHPEEGLTGDREDGSFHTFFDDDLGANTSFESQMQFLHTQYFPRLHWAKLVLNPAKSHFFMESISMLGFSADGSGLRPNASKLDVLEHCPTPQSEAKLDSFIHLTTCLRNFIPGHTEHVRMMQTAFKKIPEKTVDETKCRENLEKARGWRERKQNRTFPKRQTGVAPVPDSQRSARPDGHQHQHRTTRDRPDRHQHRTTSDHPRRR
jgi:hypothetical protein